MKLQGYTHNTKRIRIANNLRHCIWNNNKKEFK